MTQKLAKSEKALAGIMLAAASLCVGLIMLVAVVMDNRGAL